MARPLASASRGSFVRGIAFALAAALAPPLSGCAATSGAPPRVEGSVTPVDVQDKDFAASVERVLRDGKPSPERLALLLGVVRRQLAHADARFKQSREEGGTHAVIGGLYLVRDGEARPEMIDAPAAHALGLAVDRLAPRGDEGQSLALMRLLQPSLKPGSIERARLDEHMAALSTWMHEARTGPPLKRLGDDEKAAVARALLEPTSEALTNAKQTVLTWMDRAEQTRALAMRGQFTPDDFDELRIDRQGMLHMRAEETGPSTLAALFLRQGDAEHAAESLERAPARSHSWPVLQELLRGAARNDGARDWLALAAFYARADEDDDVFGIDPEIQLAALWGTSLEAYRRDPKSREASMLLSRVLLHYGIPEAAPVVLGDALAAHPSQAATVEAMELVVDAIAQAADVEGPDAARRVFSASTAILAEADRGHVEPSSGRVRFLMASIEVRAGNLTVAKALLADAVRTEPTASGFTTLAQVHRQLGDARAAEEAIAAAVRAPDAQSQPLDVAEAEFVGFELGREAKDEAQANRSLAAALASTLAARQQRANAATRARGERLLGRILEQYGETKGAARAYERALSAAGTDRTMLGAAMLDAIGRALVRRDLASARATLKRGLDSNVAEEDLVYGGLCVQLLERQAKSPPDGTVDRALHAGAHSSWTNKLALWAAGKISDSDLATAAQSPSQKVEAAFYAAMARKVAGDPSAEQSLRAVASAPVIDMLEVDLARELTAPQLRATLPGNIQAP